MKEFVRKFFVSLKRGPQMIPMVMLVIAFLSFSLGLTNVANTTERINTANMGQCEFATMLFSILALVCFLQCFPKRQKPKYIMIAILVLMLVLMIFTDSVYLVRINEALTHAESPIVVDDRSLYIPAAQNTVTVHIVLIVVTLVLLAALPIYSKLLKKINTSIDVEGNEGMAEIDISGEDE